MNDKSIGICLVGNFDLTVPTIAQEISLKHLYKEIIGRYPELKGKIYPHRKYANKTCYGKNLADNWAELVVQERVEIVTPPVIVNEEKNMAKIATNWDVLKKMLTATRMKSLYWRTGMMVLAVIVNQGLMLVSTSGLNSPSVVLLGLILGEISKSINNALSENEK